MSLYLFRWIALIEGITTVMLFVFAMPLKYGAGKDALIQPFGMAHGVAFIIYVMLMVWALSQNRVGPMGWLRCALAGLIPFGTFVNHRWLERLGEEPATV